MSHTVRQETWRKRKAYLKGLAVERMCQKCQRKAAMSKVYLDEATGDVYRKCLYCGHVVYIRKAESGG